MRLSSFTDYSLRVLMYLALRPERLSTIPEIAAAYAISANHLMKVVHQLSRNGILTSVRGKGGGIRLAVPAKQIRLGTVVRLAEGDAAVVECLGHGANCCLTPACKLAGVLQQAFGALYEALDRYTLADIVKEPNSLKKLLSLQS